MYFHYISGYNLPFKKSVDFHLNKLERISLKDA